MRIAYTLLSDGICTSLALNDVDDTKLQTEIFDLKQCLPLVGTCCISGSTNVSVTSNSNIIVMCPGEPMKENESRQDLIQRNTELFKKVVPDLAKQSPNAVFFVVTNPQEVMTYVTRELSGFPEERVLGHGTNLDSCRLRYFISEKLGISPKSCDAWVIGEHGNTSVPLWSSVDVGGVNLLRLNPQLGTEQDPDKLDEEYFKIISKENEMTKSRGASWATALGVSRICKSILKNEKKVYCVSTSAKNWHQRNTYNVNERAFLSLPCVVGRNGILAVLSQELTDTEQERLKKGIKTLTDSVENLKF